MTAPIKSYGFELQPAIEGEYIANTKGIKFFTSDKNEVTLQSHLEKMVSDNGTKVLKQGTFIVADLNSPLPANGQPADIIFDGVQSIDNDLIFSRGEGATAHLYRSHKNGIASIQISAVLIGRAGGYPGTVTLQVINSSRPDDIGSADVSYYNIIDGLSVSPIDNKYLHINLSLPGVRLIKDHQYSINISHSASDGSSIKLSNAICNVTFAER